ncbi:hypothetical protein BDY19DRAFT_995840 [Irpex rosettiformis]|uniref:Uncharacterized protein n=1 Tax=Irpex rosettiformis TaxID=378272 RepID=A0ACB8TXH0_9APHY|nr:hypothetical protein BDY19DRAFT_995840 [Irpex rosettiformis]
MVYTREFQHISYHNRDFSPPLHQMKPPRNFQQHRKAFNATWPHSSLSETVQIHYAPNPRRRTYTNGYPLAGRSAVPSEMRNSGLHYGHHYRNSYPHASSSIVLDNIEEEDEGFLADSERVGMAVEVIPEWDDLLSADGDVQMLDAFSPRGTCFSSACPWGNGERIFAAERPRKRHCIEFDETDDFVPSPKRRRKTKPRRLRVSVNHLSILYRKF